MHGPAPLSAWIDDPWRRLRMSDDQQNPYAAPASLGADLSQVQHTLDGEGIYRQDKLLVLRRAAQLPDICLLTNEPAPWRSDVTLSWAPMWILLGLPLGVWPYLILAFFLEKKATVSIPVAHSVLRRRRIHFGLVGLVIVGGIGVTFLEVGLSPERQGIAAAWGLLVIMGAVVWGILGRGRFLSTRKIDEKHVWLKGVHPQYLERWPRFAGPRS